MALMTTLSRESGVFLRSLSPTDAIVRPMERRYGRQRQNEESSMVFMMALLISIVVCDWLFCGELQRLSDAAMRNARHRYAQVALRLTIEDRQAIGSGCRWE
jgi:hypothetical protein